MLALPYWFFMPGVILGVIGGALLWFGREKAGRDDDL
jgi:hypothetical protein